MEEHDDEPMVLTSPARLAKGILIVGLTLVVGAAILLTFFHEMIANPPPVTRIKPPTPNGGGEQPPPAPAGTTTISMLAGASVQGSPDFKPDPAEVPLGNKLVWNNEDTVPHTATSGTGPDDADHGKLFDTSLVLAGKSSNPVELKDAKEGDSISYYCSVHPYMNGKITITAKAAGGETSGGGAPAGGPALTILQGSSVQGSKDFDPDPLTVKKGDKVTVTNTDTIIHTVTNGKGSDDPNSGKLFDTKFLNPKATAEIDTASMDAGSYPFYCQVHPYMQGTLVVQ